MRRELVLPLPCKSKSGCHRSQLIEVLNTQFAIGGVFSAVRNKRPSSLTPLTSRSLNISVWRISIQGLNIKKSFSGFNLKRTLMTRLMDGRIVFS